MPVRKATAEWKGDLKEGTGTVSTESGAVEGGYSFGSRFESGTGTNPEELIGAAYAACFSMALSNNLAKAGFTPDSVRSAGSVHMDLIDGGFEVTSIRLDTEARVPGIDPGEFQNQVEAARTGCPIAKVLTGTELQVTARLV